MTKMKCPLFPQECLKEECAWWLEDIQMCAIRDLALEFRYTQLRLADIRDNLSIAEENKCQSMKSKG